MRNQDHYPLFEVKTSPDLGCGAFWIVAQDTVQACERVKELFKKKGLANPRINSVVQNGTIDFLPVVKRRYFNV